MSQAWGIRALLPQEELPLTPSTYDQLHDMTHSKPHKQFISHPTHLQGLPTSKSYVPHPLPSTPPRRQPCHKFCAKQCDTVGDSYESGSTYKLTDISKLNGDPLLEHKLCLQLFRCAQVRVHFRTKSGNMLGKLKDDVRCIKELCPYTLYQSPPGRRSYSTPPPPSPPHTHFFLLN